VQNLRKFTVVCDGCKRLAANPPAGTDSPDEPVPV